MQQVALGGEGVRIGPSPLNPIALRSISSTANADQQLAMNGDQLQPGQRCASTSNRNFEGRQGKGGRTHLVSPAMAAATAAAGHFVDIRYL